MTVSSTNTRSPTNTQSGAVQNQQDVEETAPAYVEPDLFLPEAPSPPPPPKKPNRFSLQALGGSRVGRTVASAAVLGAIFGAMLGEPEGALKQGAPVTMVAEAQRGHQVADVQAAFAQITSVVAPNGIPRDDVMSALRTVSVSVVLDNGVQPGADGTGLSAERGTTLTVSLSNSGYTITASPAMQWQVDWSPDPTIRSIRYDFASAAFTAEASGLGPDGLYQDAVTDATNKLFRARMPEQMREPGYGPWQDPNLETNLQSLVDLFVGTSAPSKSSRSSGTTQPSSSISSPSVGFSFVVREDQAIPLAQGEATAWVDAGTIVHFSVGMSGAPTDPTLRRAQLSFSEPIEITRPDERGATMAKMILSSATLSPGGQVTLDYRLGAEETLDGVRGLFLLFAVAAEPRLALQNPTISATRLDGERGRIQARIDGDLEPVLEELVRRHDTAIEGISLTKLFGFE